MSVGINDILVKFTWNGDANLDGVVDLDDYAIVDNNMNTSVDSWYEGDFNYDGVVNLDDAFLIDQAYLAQDRTLSVCDPQTAVVAVPEPAMGALVAVAGLMLARRRR